MVEYISIVAMSIPKATPFGVCNVPFAVAYISKTVPYSFGTTNRALCPMGWPNTVRCRLVYLAASIIPIEAHEGQNKSC